MILINLFPHREAARKGRRDRFVLSMGLSIVAGALVAGGVLAMQDARVAAQRARNDALRAEIRRLDAQIKDISDLQQDLARLRARQSAVEDLQALRNLPVHLLNELVLQLPEGVYLTQLKQDNATILLQGVAQSNERVSELLRKFSHQSEWLSDPELVEIVAGSVSLGARDARRVANFQMRVRLAPASSARADGAPIAPPRLAPASSAPASLPKT